MTTPSAGKPTNPWLSALIICCIGSGLVGGLTTVASYDAATDHGMTGVRLTGVFFLFIAGLSLVSWLACQAVTWVAPVIAAPAPGQPAKRLG